jgi:hypothetical protein
MDCKGVKEGIEINTSPLKDIELVESWGSHSDYYDDVAEVLDVGAMWICRSMPTFQRNLSEDSLLVCIPLPYSLPLAPLSSALSPQALYKPSISLPCHFSPWRWRQHVSLKRWHRPTNSHGTKTQDLNNNM